jgi:hypothetical protein
MLMPTRAELMSIQLFYKDTLLDEISTGTPPIITITSPVPANLTGSKFTLNWQGKSGQTYIVRFSDDGGKSWRVISPPMTETSLEIDLEALPGTRNGILEVVASTGLLSTFERSTSFSLANSAPRVAIFSLENTVTVSENTLVTLSGNAFDLEDERLPSSSFVWISDQDGVLGTGTMLTARLSPGTHTIFLQVTDADGNIREVGVWKVYLPWVVRNP